MRTRRWQARGSRCASTRRYARCVIHRCRFMGTKLVRGIHSLHSDSPFRRLITMAPVEKAKRDRTHRNRKPFLEKRKPPRTKESRSRTAEATKKKEKRLAENFELSKEDLYTCSSCYKVKPRRTFHSTSRLEIFTVRELRAMSRSR